MPFGVRLSRRVCLWVLSSEESKQRLALNRKEGERERERQAKGRLREAHVEGSANPDREIPPATQRRHLARSESAADPRH